MGNPVCPLCGDALHIHFSSCTDSSCCGIENEIKCSGDECTYIYETLSFDDFEDKLKELGASDEAYKQLKKDGGS